MKTTLLFIFGIFLQLNLAGQDDLIFVWDKNASSIANAENLISVHRMIYEFQDQHIKSSYWKEDNWKGKSLGVGYRFAKTILIENPINYFAHLYQHEVFGHGFRYREFEYKRSSFHIFAPPPYGKGGGFARRGTTEFNRKLGIHEAIAINSGGMEAAAVLSGALKKKWLIQGEINYRESMLYLSTLHDYTIYILSTELLKRDNDGNDVNNYLRTVNASYGNTNPNNYGLTRDDISKRTSVNLINTFQLFAVYTFVKVYLLDAEDSFKYPMIKLGKTKWLPSVRFGLTPFGSEFIVENYFKKPKRVAGVSIRIGDNKLDKFWGGGLFYHLSYAENIQLSSYADFWVQPAMELGGETLYNTRKGFGGRFLAEINYHFNDTFPIGLYSQIGYKTAGFIEGEQLDKGLIVRVGMSIRTRN